MISSHILKQKCKQKFPEIAASPFQQLEMSRIFGPSVFGTFGHFFLYFAFGIPNIDTGKNHEHIK